MESVLKEKRSLFTGTNLCQTHWHIQYQKVNSALRKSCVRSKLAYHITMSSECRFGYGFVVYIVTKDAVYMVTNDAVYIFTKDCCLLFTKDCC